MHNSFTEFIKRERAFDGINLGLDEKKQPKRKKRIVDFKPIRIPKKPDNRAVNESSKKNFRIS
ncbi:hypothetical protein LEP1GSC043_4581 [Leptospira weilii str. Ecochallenge]|uniref:Uncharacterized protein n=1 Tax=Leptospira weilii str. Ecochallenge TaxID=1049986 RepID=N1UC93_9LEPT|nr:hypothetical protein LEP1GSC043_4581 [Leptospira weilii str. Ecochallenge]